MLRHNFYLYEHRKLAILLAALFSIMFATLFYILFSIKYAMVLVF